MKSNKVGIGQNLPCNINNNQNKIVQQSNKPISPQLGDLANFINTYNKMLSNNDAMLIADVIMRVSNYHRVDYRVVTALVAIESGFNPCAKSPSGAMGLGQLMPTTARGLNVNNPFDPNDNLNGAVKLLRSHLESYQGDINFALAAYKMGSGTVSRRGINQSTTIGYIKKIRSIYDRVP
ncbi:MAG: lytic transglycosylase domain-containing protein [Cyanobacteriota bacterium]